MSKHLAIIAALTMACPAWATCEWPAMPPNLSHAPGMFSAWSKAVEGDVAHCRQVEADKAAAQEREDIHAIREALEGIEASAARIGR